MPAKLGVVHSSASSIAQSIHPKDGPIQGFSLSFLKISIELDLAFVGRDEFDSS